MELDLLVIGSGPGGQKAAIQAAKLGKRVAVAERRNRLGGVSIHTGTIPSKTLRLRLRGLITVILSIGTAWTFDTV